MTEFGSEGTVEVAQLWGQLAQPLRRFFARRAAPGEVEDLLQDTFLAVIEHSGELRDDDRVAGWIQRIAHNTWVDWSRRRRTEPWEGELEGRTDETELEREVAGWVVAAIGGLEEGQREVLCGIELEGRSLVEVARELGLDYEVAKSRARRGRAKVRRRLEDCCAFEFGRGGALLDVRRKGRQQRERCDCD